jgi:nucleotide-binding universal stress UspA family protein
MLTYASLLVHLELGRTNAGLLQFTGELAERFKAGVIGIAVRQPLQMVYSDGYVSGDVYERDRIEIAKEMKAVESEFRAALQGRVRTVEWRCAERYAYLADYLAAEARAADLIVTGVAAGDLFDSSRAVSTGDLIMQAGRPVLTVPTAATTLKLDHVLIGWKDTREARRAACDALPLLEQASAVSVVEIAGESDLDAAHRHVADVVNWLQRHHIEAQGSAQLSTGDDATALYALGQDEGVDVIVAGAYGHSRLREWVLGGVTRDLLLSANRCSLVSH